jgi:hypothetical protein
MFYGFSRSQYRQVELHNRLKRTLSVTSARAPTHAHTDTHTHTHTHTPTHPHTRTCMRPICMHALRTHTCPKHTQTGTYTHRDRNKQNCNSLVSHWLKDVVPAMMGWESHLCTASVMYFEMKGGLSEPLLVYKFARYYYSSQYHTSLRTMKFMYWFYCAVPVQQAIYQG